MGFEPHIYELNTFVLQNSKIDHIPKLTHVHTDVTRHIHNFSSPYKPIDFGPFLPGPLFNISKLIKLGNRKTVHNHVPISVTLVLGFISPQIHRFSSLRIKVDPTPDSPNPNPRRMKLIGKYASHTEEGSGLLLRVSVSLTEPVYARKQSKKLFKF